VLDYRQIAKLKSTYVDALPQLVNPRTGRVHTSFNQTGTETGRLSSSEPNLQNIPARTEMGREVRRAFVAGRPQSVFLAADYSQIELRILAHITHDAKLVEAFTAEEDIHSATAAEIFSVPIDAVTPEMRRFAKTVNFGIIYGMSDYGLSTRAGLSRQEAGEYITQYKEKYPRVWEYLEETKRQAARQGYVSTLLGRRRRLPEINSPNRQVKMAAERMAINMPIQGTAADVIKLAMIDLHRKLQQLGSDSQLILQVHDELVLEVPAADLREMRDLVSATMESAMQMSVPLKVDVEAGPNWRDLEHI
jgi:DNA polymerase I